MGSVNFGLWYDFRNPGPDAPPFEAFYGDALAQIESAEALGFDSVWLTEHHFCADGYTPSPLVLAGAIAARTRRLRIGTNLVILPVHDPVRIAEDAATLAIVSGGRFDLGVAIGYRELEFAAFGRSLRHRPGLMEEAIAVIRRAWSGAPLDFAGRHFSYGGVNVTPTPARPPRLLIGGMSEPAIDRAVRLGDGFLSTGGIGHDLYTAALARHGRDPGTLPIFAGHWAIISPDPAGEAERIGRHVLYQANEYIRWGAFGPPDTTPLFPDAKTALTQGLYELWDADTAVAKLSELIETWPSIADIHFWAQFPGEPVESGQRRIEYIAERVLPRLR